MFFINFLLYLIIRILDTWMMGNIMRKPGYCRKSTSILSLFDLLTDGEARTMLLWTPSFKIRTWSTDRRFRSAVVTLTFDTVVSKHGRDITFTKLSTIKYRNTTKNLETFTCLVNLLVTQVTSDFRRYSVPGD